jgi:opacity protein-like surface antigen
MKKITTNLNKSGGIMKKLILLLVCAFFAANMSYAQETPTQKKTEAPGKYKRYTRGEFNITLFGGFDVPASKNLTQPGGNQSEGYKTGGRFGLDLGFRINKEVSVHGTFGYSILAPKTQTTLNSHIIDYTVGPRYHFVNRNLSSSIFADVGAGGYSLITDTPTNPPPGFTSSQTNFGVNAGIGADLAISKAMDIVVATRYHTIFGSGSSGNTSFVGITAGLLFSVR